MSIASRFLWAYHLLKKTKKEGRGSRSRHGLQMDRTSQPPANGVVHCETDADRV